MVKKKKADSPAKMPKRYLYVEGGGDSKKTPLASDVRKAFQKMFEKAGVQEKPAVVVCGGRQQAYNQFCTELALGRNQAWLLVDAEDLAPALKPGDAADPWAHVKARQEDILDRPTDATDDQLHLMNVTMETWLVCDRDALYRRFGPKINLNKLPPDNASLESKPKDVINKAIDDAVKATPSKKYSKGSHSFKILEDIDPVKLRRMLFWADRFLLAMGAPPLPEGSASMAVAPKPTPRKP